MAGTKTLKVIISGDAKGAIAALKELDTASARSQEKSAGLGKSALMAGAAVGVGIVAIGAVAVKASETYAKVGREVIKFQRFTGLSAESASRLRVAFKLTGIDGDKAAKALGQFSRNLVSDKVSDYTKTITGVGIETRTTTGKLLPMHDILLKVADRFKSLPAGAERTALAMKLFGKAGAEMLPFLSKGAAGIKELERQSDRFGTTLSGKDIAAIKESTAQGRLLSLGWEGLQIQIGRYVLPVIDKLVLWLTDHLPAAIKTTREWVGKLVDGIGSVIDAFQSLPSWMQKGIAGFLGFVAVIGPAVKIIGAVGGKAALVGRIITGLGSAMTTAGLEVAAFIESTSLLTAGLTLLAGAGIVVGGVMLFKAIIDDGNRAKDVAKSLEAEVRTTGGTLKSVFAQDLRQSLLGKSFKEGGVFNTGHIEYFVKEVKHAGRSFEELNRGLTGTHKQWRTLFESIGSHSEIMRQFGEDLQQIRNSYIGAMKALAPYVKGLDDQQAKSVATAAATVSVGESTKKLTGNVKLLANAAKDTAYIDLLKTAKTTIEQVSVAAVTASIPVAKMLKMDPKDVLAAADAMTKLVNSTHDAITSAGSVTNVSSDLLKYGAAGIKAFLSDQIKQNEIFAINIQTVMSKHLDPAIIADLITAGPAKAGPVLEQIVKGNVDTNIRLFNDMTKTIQAQAATVAEQARIVAAATGTDGGSQKKIRDMGDAFRISFATGLGAHPMTPEEMGRLIGVTPAAAVVIANEFQLAWVPPKIDVNKTPADQKFALLKIAADIYKAMTPTARADLDALPANQRFAVLNLKAVAWQRTHATASADLDISAVLWKTAQLQGAVTRALAGNNKVDQANAIRASLFASGALQGGHAAGGFITGGVAGRDSVPSMLMPGEFVLRKSAVDRVGVGNLSRLNDGRNGAPMSTSSAGGGGGTTVVVNVHGSVLSERDLVDVIKRQMRRGVLKV